MSKARTISVAVLAALSLGASASPATGAVTLGQTATPSGTCLADFDRLVQTPSSGNSYVVPNTVPTGTITSWSHIAIGNASQVLTMKVFRRLGGTIYGVVGHDTEALAPGATNTFPASIAVKAGDVLGLYSNTGNTGCLFTSDPGNELYTRMGNLPDGGAGEFTLSLVTSTRTNISAVLEPDCDQDGLGDETQDTDLSSCAPGTTPTGPITGPGGTPVTCGGLNATIAGTNGSDVRTGTLGRDVIAGLGGNDTLSGIAGNDVICGGAGKDNLKGGKGKDTLLGQKGKDALKGGGGKDLCKGGKGNDTAAKCEVEKSI